LGVQALQRAEKATERSEEATDLQKLLKELIKRRESQSFTGADGAKLSYSLYALGLWLVPWTGCATESSRGVLDMELEFDTRTPPLQLKPAEGYEGYLSDAFSGD
jgi:hypothetical protein